MLKTIKAHYTQGRIEPIEPLFLREGAEIEVTITVTRPTKKMPDATEATAGAWSDLLDCEEFEEEVYENRLINTRPAVSL
ncbi:MAG: antitoxin family protein [Armatimonadota bacterium]|nr:antitoxin family protein [Armatimonadota bacterium]